jgi:hypothetical protein
VGLTCLFFRTYARCPVAPQRFDFYLAIRPCQNPFCLFLPSFCNKTVSIAPISHQHFDSNPSWLSFILFHRQRVSETNYLIEFRCSYHARVSAHPYKCARPRAKTRGARGQGTQHTPTAHYSRVRHAAATARCGSRAPSTAIRANLSCFLMQRRLCCNCFFDAAGNDLWGRLVAKTGRFGGQVQ